MHVVLEKKMRDMTAKMQNGRRKQWNTCESYHKMIHEKTDWSRI